MRGRNGMKFKSKTKKHGGSIFSVSSYTCFHSFLQLQFFSYLSCQFNQRTFRFLHENFCLLNVSYYTCYGGFTVNHHVSMGDFNTVTKTLHGNEQTLFPLTEKLVKLLPNQFVIFKPLSYCFKETIGFDVKASFASRP